jgi:hypothetical protein
MKRSPNRVRTTPNHISACGTRNATSRTTHPQDETVVLQLTVDDAPRIAQLDCESWPQALRVSETTVVHRFELGHSMLGVEHDDELLGVVAFSYTSWSPQPTDTFPVSNAQFNSQPHDEQHNCAFAYNLVTHPKLRGSSISRRLIAAGLAQLRCDGCEYLLGHARCPSYNGSDVPGIEHFSANIAFRHAIDDAVQADTLPGLDVLLLDPVLRFYYRALRCTFVRIMPGFLPDDEASGGNAVRFFKRLRSSNNGQHE